MTASEEALRSVDGIGSNTAERICWAVREPEPAYGTAVKSSAGIRPFASQTIDAGKTRG